MSLHACVCVIAFESSSTDTQYTKMFCYCVVRAIVYLYSLYIVSQSSISDIFILIYVIWMCENVLLKWNRLYSFFPPLFLFVCIFRCFRLSIISIEWKCCIFHYSTYVWEMFVQSINYFFQRHTFFVNCILLKHFFFRGISFNFWE